MQKSSRWELSANAAYLCTFFFEKKVRKKAIQEAHPPEKPPVKVQGGAYLPRRLHQSKGGSAVRILKTFLIVQGFGVRADGGKKEALASHFGGGGTVFRDGEGEIRQRRGKPLTRLSRESHSSRRRLQGCFARLQISRREKTI